MRGFSPMPRRGIYILMISAMLLAGCSADSGPKETSGAVIGGVAGGLIGSTVGHGNGQVAATVLGAALGAVVGGSVGRSLDDADRDYAYRAANQACSTGKKRIGKIRKAGIAESSCRANPITMRSVRCAGISNIRSGSKASRKWWMARPASSPTAAGAWWGRRHSPYRRAWAFRWTEGANCVHCAGSAAVS